MFLIYIKWSLFTNIVHYLYVMVIIYKYKETQVKYVVHENTSVYITNLLLLK